METPQVLGFTHFLAQTDSIGRFLLAVLLLMSVITWYLIAVKSISAVLQSRLTRRFLANFANASSLQSVAAGLEQQQPGGPFSRLAWQAIAAARHHQQHRERGAGKLDDAGSAAEFVTRAMRRVIGKETARCESGLTALASVGSTAPFVGLFGTVWGVYHALAAIGQSGQGTLDQVAGPVGEALIMTALGLAVAIPAVLAYNFTVRRNRLVLAQLDAFTHDLFAFLTTGSNVGDPADSAQATTPGRPFTIAKAGA